RKAGRESAGEACPHTGAHSRSFISTEEITSPLNVAPRTPDTAWADEQKAFA
ncbi:hypothetical protein P7K49_018619, partial [Saguinus oedipus]